MYQAGMVADGKEVELALVMGGEEEVVLVLVVGMEAAEGITEAPI